MKRLFFTPVIALFFLSLFAQKEGRPDRVAPAAITVTLLGTGTPPPLMERFGPSILVQAGPENLLFDAGRGCLQRLRQLDVSYDKLSGLFLTHLHSDHIVGLPDLWLTGWLVSSRTAPMPLFGPAGTNNLAVHLQKAFSADIDLRIANDKQVRAGSALAVTEIREGVVFEKGGVKVKAFTVDHYDNIPAVGYRVDYNGHSVVLSGDTRYSENVTRFARGTDLLIHEVVVAPDTMGRTDPRYNILMQHATPGQVARVFSDAGPKLAVYSHLSKLYGKTEEDIVRETKKTYAGPLAMGEDLMRFSIGDSVAIQRWPYK